MDREDRAYKNIRLEAPTFDGCLDPKVYIDWEGEVDQYFEWCDMSEEHKFRFAKLKLVCQARLYWATIERTHRLEGRESIITWRGMKAKLRGKYVTPSYH